jgi:hypothetical protein
LSAAAGLVCFLAAAAGLAFADAGVLPSMTNAGRTKSPANHRQEREGLELMAGLSKAKPREPSSKGYVRPITGRKPWMGRPARAQIGTRLAGSA